MKRNCCGLLCMMAIMMLTSGCGIETSENGEQGEPDVQISDKNAAEEMYSEAEQAMGELMLEAETELEEYFLSAEEDMNVPTITEMFAEETEYPELTQFLIEYYRIPVEDQSETRYYYNYVDLNDDGATEIFVVVIGEYTEQPNGDPALVLTVSEVGEFEVVESFEAIHTPVTISDQTTNGWHDIIYYEYGRGKDDGFRVCHYNPQGGYQTELSEVVEEMEPIGGMQILSNNLIDDMDQGRYLTLAPQPETETE